jgi:DNA topoisomerase VI subunit A
MAKETKDVKKKLVDLGRGIVKDIEAEKNPELVIPLRALSNVYFDEKAKTVALGNKTSSRFLFNVAHIRKFAQTMEVAATAKQLLEADKHLSLRQTFYKMRGSEAGGVDIVEEQTESDKAIEDLEVMVGNVREQFNINANKLGSIAGNVVIKDGDDTIDWSKMGSGGWSIPSNVENIEFKKVDAKFIIYMEKAAMWERLHEDRLWKKLNCIIVSSQGQATRGIRRLLNRLNTEHKLPVYVLVDADIWGAYIYSVLKYGSINLAAFSDGLTIPDCKLLGMTMDDVEKYNLKKFVIKMKDVDLARIKQIRNYDWFKKNKDWQRQFDMMEKLKGKVELDALVNKGISFVSETYIPEKLKAKDYLE